MASPTEIVAFMVIIFIVILSRIQKAIVSHAAVIAGSVTGAVVLMVILVYIYRKCHPKVKESRDTGVQLTSSHFYEREENEEYCYCTLDRNDPLNTNTSITPPKDTASSNENVSYKNSDSASQGRHFNAFQGDGQTMIRKQMPTPEIHPRINAPGTAIYNTTKPSNLSSDVYDIISDYKRPAFDNTYDHLPTNVKEEYDMTDLTKHNRCDAGQTYEDMATCSSGVDEKPNIASHNGTEPDQNNT